jgi:2-polyprenyl-6-methoxyphenol hydroxylase-like FAD-dependent oxidoreductase
MWWSTFQTSSLPDTKLNPTNIKTDLQTRHQGWHDPIIRSTIRDAEVESIYPTWTMPDLPHWGEKGIVLVGDAAHAMDPGTGQGVSQVLEDTQALPLLLREVLEGQGSERYGANERERVNVAIKIFYEVRSGRVREIVERGKKMEGSKKDLGLAMEYCMYFYLWLMLTFPVLGKFSSILWM